MMDSIDSAMLQAFGDRYINLRKYLMEDGLRDAGLSATTQDERSIANGCVPNSFRSNASGADLNGVAYILNGQSLTAEDAAVLLYRYIVAKGALPFDVQSINQPNHD